MVPSADDEVEILVDDVNDDPALDIFAQSQLESFFKPVKKVGTRAGCQLISAVTGDQWWRSKAGSAAPIIIFAFLLAGSSIFFL